MNKDISHFLKGWDYKPGQITVRRIQGDDGMDKIQLRLDLGILQMETVGRPDGTRPRGYESLLHFHQYRLDDHIRRNGTELGFALSAKQSMQLREEGVMYYHRYLAMFVLEEYEQVVRDTERNLALAEFCHKYAGDEKDRMALEQYRPYIIMMNSRAKGNIDLNNNAPKTALAHLRAGLENIKSFFSEYGQEEIATKCNETVILKTMVDEIQDKLNKDPIEKMRSKLQQLVDGEQYEQAAALRDQIQEMESRSDIPQQ